MPALITHDTFGRDVYDHRHSFIGGTRDEADAFLLGNQGPDPLFYSVLSPRLHAVHRLGNRMHNEKPSELLEAFKQSLFVLKEGERGIGRAYALGFLCHYLLDSTMHPFVFFQEYQACDAGEPGLDRSHGSEVHGVIESEFDELVLYTKRGETIATFDPSREVLKASDHALAVVSKMYAYVALTLFGIFIPANAFGSSVKLFRRAQAFFYSPKGIKRDVVARIEEVVRPHSFYRAMSHRCVALEESMFDNREHAPWKDPFTGAVSNDGFWERYGKALARTDAALAAFDRDDFDVEVARAITGDLDFSGEPTTARIVAVEDGAADGVRFVRNRADKDSRARFSLGRAFSCAWEGVVYTARTQRNMKIHFAVGAAAVLLGAALGIDAASWAAIVICIVLVLAAECLNTAVESVVDLVPPDYAELAKHAKCSCARWARWR